MRGSKSLFATVAWQKLLAGSTPNTFSRMRLDKVVEAVGEEESGSSLEECCRILGCIDLRTARVHLRKLEEAAKTAALDLAERQAATVHLHDPGYHPRPLTPLGRLEEMLARQEEAHLRVGGGRRRPPELRTLLQAVLWKNRGKVLMSYASRPPPDSCYHALTTNQRFNKFRLLCLTQVCGLMFVYILTPRWPSPEEA